MNFSKELQEKINVLFENNEELKKRILGGEADVIRQIGLTSQKGIKPEDIVDAYESNDTEKMECLYKKAKRALELQKLYRELCREYYEKNIIDEER